ncbi:flagellar motor switch protein FliY [Sulfurospirillum sp. T05]|uniref:Flagellar motor switch protein FliN n=1 Tax=Sulfurospirillum tamanense TaxID=2813362 RepID=A0ABS2WPZ6_9BACT|nr:flagellar motor switch protein FliY [Sulfurospirillum tamanensis]MBN2963473.1 flagellar motor switch protein FliY [Sulfurospirillum tamanensis]
MNEFIALLGQELVSTVEGLTGQTPTLELVDTADVNKNTSVVPPMAIAKIAVSGATEGSMKVAIAPGLATGIGALMMGEEEAVGKEEMDEDDLDATKEIVSNVLGSFSTALGGQKALPKLNFAVESITFVDATDTIDFTGMHTAYIHSMGVQGIVDQIIFVTDGAIEKTLGNVQNDTPSTVVSNEEKNTTVNDLSSEEMRNIALIMDVQLPVRVRIGSKKMLLKDVLSMDIGSVIELNQLANDPLEILVGDKIVAMGEVVIVDGNFGVQITEIGTKRERLEKLR